MRLGTLLIEEGLLREAAESNIDPKVTLRSALLEEGFGLKRARGLDLEVWTDVVTIAFGSQKRPVVVLQKSGMHRMAFYRSTGTGGQSDAGDWVPFFGLADMDGAAVPWLNHVWFVKWETKVPAPGTDEYEMTHLLAEMDGSGQLDPGMVYEVPYIHTPRNDAKIQDIKDAYEACGSFNSWLKFHGAMREAEKWARGYPFIGYLNSSADWKSWSSNMVPFLKPMLKRANLKPSDVMGMTLKELTSAAGLTNREAIAIWRTGRG